MANVKVSELGTATQIADDDYIYLVDSSEGTNGSKKVSIATLQARIAGSGDDESGSFEYEIANPNLPDWNSQFTISSNIGTTEKNYFMPFDFFAYTQGDSDKVKIYGNTIPTTLLNAGIHCPMGTNISISGTSSLITKVYIVPLLYGNIDTENCTMIKNYTPLQLTQFIQDNKGTSGNGYFVDNATYGAYGMDENASSASSNWVKIDSSTPSTQKFRKFGIKYKVKDGYYAIVSYPGTYSRYTQLKENGVAKLNRKSGNASTRVSQLFSTITSHAMTQDRYDVISMAVFNIQPSSD